LDMQLNTFRRRIRAGCCALLLIPAGAALAQNTVDSRGEVWAFGGNVRAGALEGSRIFGEAPRAPEPWFRRTFVVVQTDGTWAVKPVVRGAAQPQPAKAEPTLPETQPPGVVRNLRRIDQR